MYQPPDVEFKHGRKMGVKDFVDQLPSTNEDHSSKGFGTAFADVDQASCGNFYMSSPLNQAPNPCLQISELGVIGLPLSKHDAEAVVSFAKQYFLEPRVGHEGACDAWKIQADRISFANPKWASFIDGHVCHELCQALGVGYIKPRPRLELSALQICRSGSHSSIPHHDFQTADSTFASVTILLPSEYTGAEVRVSHANKTEVLDFSQSSLVDTALLAWYSNVKHEVNPVTSGYRFALSYNLIYEAPPGVPKPIFSERNKAAIALRRVLKRWRDGDFSVVPKTPYLVYILDNHYSASQMKEGTGGLKDDDAYKIALLHKIAEEFGFKVGLASLKHHIPGPARDLAEMKEVESTSTSVTNLVDLKGNPWHETQSSISPTSDNIVQDDPFEDEDPDDTDDMGSTAYIQKRHQRSVAFIAKRDDMDTIGFAAGGLTYAYKKIKVLSAKELNTSVMNEFRQWLAKIITSEQQPSKDQVIQILELATRWKDLQSFNSIIEMSGCCLSAIPRGIFVEALKAFSFEPLKTSFEKLLQRSDLFAEKINLIYSIIEPNALPEEKQDIMTWCGEESSRMMSSYSIPDPSVVPTIMVLIRAMGLCRVKRLMISNLVKQKDTYSFLIALVKALREDHDSTSNTPVHEGDTCCTGHSITPHHEEAVDDLITECLVKASAQWSQLPQTYSNTELGSYISTVFGTPNVPQTKRIDRIVEVFEQALLCGNQKACKTAFADILKAPGTYSEKFTQIYKPLIPRLKSLLASQNLYVSSHPFVDLFRVLIGTYLCNVLGAKGQLSNFRLRRIGCGCLDCTGLDQFILNPNSLRESFKLLQKNRLHLEGRLNTARDLCSYETIKFGSPHSLQVTKAPGIVRALTWNKRQQEARTFLASIGTDDMIKTIMGAQHPSAEAALSGAATYVSTTATVGTPASDAASSSGCQSRAMPPAVSDDLAVVGQKRKFLPE